MRIGVLGTGVVGQTLATALVGVGHEVRMGARDAANEKASQWVEATGEGASAGTFADAAAFGEVVVNATNGAGSLAALELAAAANLDGKALLDVSNPLDFSRGMPPSNFLPSTDSLGEQIQRAFPAARVVKALNTMSAPVMVAPGSLSGPTNVFLCGDDPGAKAEVTGILASFGWPPDRILDLGDLTAARGQEAYVLFWVRVFMTLGQPTFNIGVVTS